MPGIKLGSYVITDPDLEIAGNHNFNKFGLVFGLSLVKHAVLLFEKLFTFLLRAMNMHE